MARRRDVLIALGSLFAPSTVLGKKGHKKKKNKITPGDRVNACLTVAVPQVCLEWPTAYRTACQNDVTICCQQAALSLDAFCSCLLVSGWGHCTA